MRKRLYFLICLFILFSSSIYAHVSAKTPINVYINESKMESGEVSYFNRSADMKIIYHDILDDDIQIVLEKNDFIYDTTYEKDNGEVHFLLKEDGCYTLQVYVEKDGNNEVYMFSFYVDTQEVDASFLVNGNEIESYVYDDSIEFQIVCDDVNFDTVNSTVYINNEYKPMDWVQQENKKFISSIVFDEKGSYQMEVRICDFANNVTTKIIHLQIGNLYDIDYKINDEVVLEDKVFYNQDVIFEMNVNEMDRDEDTLEVYINNERIVVDWMEEDNKKKVLKMKLTEEGVYNICVVYKNNISDSLVFEKEVIIDKTKPIIQYRYNDESQKEYISGTRELYIEIDDKHFSKNSLELVVKKDFELYETMPLWTFHEKGCEIFIPFYEEGKYEIFAIAKDDAGNVGVWSMNHVQTDYFQSSFTIDQTAPSIELRGIVANSISNSKQELEFIAYDDHFDFYEIYATRNGEEYELAIPKRAHKSLSHSQLFEEQSVGYYEVYVHAYDLAGNMTTSDLLSFTIDVESPEVFIWLDNKPYNDGVRYLRNKSMDIKVEVKDYGVMSQQISIMKNGVEILKEVDNKNVFTYQIEDESTIDSDYQLRIEVMDLAGNTNSKLASFKLNSLTPTIHIVNDFFEGIPRKGPWIPQILYEGEQFYITDYTLTRDHTIVDYVWGNPICDDGEYTLEVFARDRAGNHISFSEAFAFIIDNTPPRILLLDEKRNSLYTDMRVQNKDKLRIETENIADNILSITVNDISLDLDKYRVMDGDVLSYMIDDMAQGANVIEIKASDLAGNVSHESVRIFVDSDFYVKHKNTIFILTFILFFFSISSYLLWSKICKLHF